MPESRHAPVFEIEYSSDLFSLAFYLAHGSTGLGVYKEYKIKLPELNAFLEFCDNVERISLRRYNFSGHSLPRRKEFLENTINTEYSSVRSEKEKLRTEEIPVEVIDKVKPHVELLWELVYGMILESKGI